MTLMDELVQIVKQNPGIIVSEAQYKLKYGHHRGSVSRALKKLTWASKVYRFKIDGLWSYGTVSEIE